MVLRITIGRRPWRRRAAVMITVLAGVAGLLGAPGGPAKAGVTAWVFDNYYTGKCMDLPGYGTPHMNEPVTQYNCNFSAIGDNQAWYFNQVGTDGSGNPLYLLQTYKGGWCLDPPGYGADPAGTHLQVYPCTYGNPSADNQEFYFRTVYADGAFEIINAKSGLCLDVSGWLSNGTDQANDLPLTLYTCQNSSWAGNGYDDHLWQKFPAT